MSAYKRVSLGAWLATAFSALSILLTVVMALVIERKAGEDVAAGIGSNMKVLAHQMTNRLDRGMFERYREVQLMAARLDRLPADLPVQLELDAAKNSYRYYLWLGVAGPDGTVLAASNGALVGDNVSNQPWFRDALQGVHLGHVQESSVLPALLTAGDAPQRFYDVAFPVQGRGGQRVLGAYVSWAWARDVRDAVFGSDPSRAEPLIVAADGRVLLGPADLEGRQLRVPSLALARAGKEGHTTERWPDGRTYVVGYDASEGFQSSPGAGWTILVRQDTDAAYAPVRALQRRVALGGGALALLFSLIGWLAARKIAQPVLGLAAAARRMEEAQVAEVETSSAYREVEVLGTALNSLLGKLAQKTGELHALNAELEQRVEQRTAELRDAFDRVRANEQRIQTIIEAAQDPFIAFDLRGRITDWSTQAEVVFGWGREEVLGRRAGELLLPKRSAADLDLALATYARTGRSQFLHRAVERVLVTRDGREIPVEVKIGLVSTGRERFFSAFLHDISQRKEVERLKDEFISTVSHELRTPLTAIYGSLNLMHSGLAGELPPDARELLSISHDSTERLIRLINDLLDLEKIASGKIEYRVQVQPLAPLVQQALRDTQPYSDGVRVELALQADADPLVGADADRIVQVCVNLLSNAVKFSQPGARVEVRVTQREGWARVSVTDQGSGVPAEFRDRVFERFAQADSSARRAKGGTGLGLAICRSIVEAHGGRIGFTSEPGVRTEFFFELPVAVG
ncbi:PAS domain S-box protein [Ramlibacter ginsenosidimutans]|uniref:histidine kinase n=1 Tax=Ramlibacter ginsenosidimutans TaxID=502333 RepID=A0A934TS04_9BURK|nr:PAS domain S-box protein [Ramlibacter ginsenosidimutans]